MLPVELLPTDEELRTLHEAQKEFHRFPERSLQEVATAKRLRTKLENMECGPGVTLEFVESASTPGFACVMRNGEGPCVGYRADMDGLPVQEDTGLPFASENEGVMHACGHDSHMAVFLGAARAFAAHPQLWSGTIVFIAQAAEESAEGAHLMIKDGMWDRMPHPEVMYGAHVVPRPAGWVSLYPGGALPGSEGYEIIMRGRGGHGSQPHTAIDPVVLGASVVMRLQTIVARMTNPDKNAVVTVGKFVAGTTDNIIPDSAQLLINTRFRDEETGKIIGDGIARIARAEAEASGAPEPFIRCIRHVVATTNEPEATERLRRELVEAAEKVFANHANEDGQSGFSRGGGLPECAPLNIVKESFGFSEDFVYWGDAIGVPSVFWLYGGMGSEQVEKFGENPPANHSPFFYADPEASLEPALRVALVAIHGRVGK
ncbi:amidohydrolase [Actinotignum urinale]|uniref:Amidohydrolase n=1 Tax=Actinotignum urinale TaxID=190146 RepID=A0ABU5G656_9ACTO|nr:amidohydrolase [Actinotignum urinale]MDY5132844.1 amidohydrolase [Actinotignum urinale]